MSANLKTVLDEIRHFQIKQAYISQNQNLVFNLQQFPLDESQDSSLCEAVVTFSDIVDYRLMTTTLAVLHPLVRVHKPKILFQGCAIYRLNTVGVMVEVIAPKIPSILLKAPFAFIANLPQS